VVVAAVCLGVTAALAVTFKLRVQGLIALLFQLLLAEAYHLQVLALGIMVAEAVLGVVTQAFHHNLVVAVAAPAVGNQILTYSMRHLLAVNPTIA
jgi:hypothetical protein